MDYEGSSNPSFGYTGEWGDANRDNEANGLLYLRSQYYAPGDGRFVSRDTWEGDANNPMSYNAWLYTYANPVRYTDPSGLDVGCNVDDPRDPRCHLIVTPPPANTPTPMPTSTGKTAYLTFDDGPDPSATPQIALYLQQRGARATFFISGTTEGGYERIPFTCISNFNGTDLVSLQSWEGSSAVKLLFDTGHAIGNHGWNHNNYWNSPLSNWSNEP
jgi:RHS repeat-associated protein